MKENFFYICDLPLSLWGMAAYSKRGETDRAIVITGSVVMKTDSAVADDTGYIVRVGEMVPDFTVVLAGGKQVGPSIPHGKTVMLQFTASRYGVCRKEMPLIEKDVWLKHQSSSEFTLIDIDRDEPLDKVIAFNKPVGVTYPLGLDPGAGISAKYTLYGSGTIRNVLADRGGRVVKPTRLYSEEEFTSLVSQIDEMLKK